VVNGGWPTHALFGLSGAVLGVKGPTLVAKDATRMGHPSMATEAANAAIRYAFGHLGAKAISIGYFDRNEPSRRIVEKLGFEKLRVARNAATRCLDGTKLDRHEYILTSPDALPELDVSWG
jgi:hypothetical protein